MIAQVVYLEVQPELLAPLLLEAAANAQASLQEPGVVQFDVLQQVDDPLKFMLYEVYRCAEDLEAHRNTPHFKRWSEVGVPMLNGERTRVLYQTVDKAFPGRQ
jgi:quinol monooxygenase YgiN